MNGQLRKHLQLLIWLSVFASLLVLRLAVYLLGYHLLCSYLVRDFYLDLLLLNYLTRSSRLPKIIAETLGYATVFNAFIMIVLAVALGWVSSPYAWFYEPMLFSVWTPFHMAFWSLAFLAFWFLIPNWSPSTKLLLVGVALLSVGYLWEFPRVFMMGDGFTVQVFESRTAGILPLAVYMMVLPNRRFKALIGTAVFMTVYHPVYIFCADIFWLNRFLRVPVLLYFLFLTRKSCNNKAGSNKCQTPMC